MRDNWFLSGCRGGSYLRSFPCDKEQDEDVGNNSDGKPEEAEVVYTGTQQRGQNLYNILNPITIGTIREDRCSICLYKGLIERAIRV